MRGVTERAGGRSWRLWVPYTVVEVVNALLIVGFLWVPDLVSRAGDPLVVGLGIALAVLSGTGVVLRWRLPIAAPIVVAVATAAGLLVGASSDPFLALAWTIYPLALRYGIRRIVLREGVFGLVLVVLVVTVLLIGDPSPPIAIAVVGLVAVSCSWTLGGTVRARVEASAREAADRERNAAVESRIEVARELHDVVAHTLGTIGVQAGVAAHVRDIPADELRATLADIEEQTRTALGRVKGLLVTLRDGRTAATSAAPGIGDVSQLLSAVRAAGVEAHVEIDPAAAALDGVEQLAVYRILQESLTNVVRHAPGARCVVRVACRERWLVVEVVDDGPGADADVADGHGLRGIRERAASVGGTCIVGPAPGGGFRVHAELPLDAAAVLRAGAAP